MVGKVLVPLVIVLAIALGLVATAQRADDDYFGPEALREIARSIPSDWRDRLSLEDRARVELHKGGITSHPMMTYQVMGVVYEPVFDLPVATFLEEYQDSNEGIGQFLMEILNIKLISPERRISYPDQAALHLDLEGRGRTEHIQLEMELRDGNQYYVRYPTSAVSKFIQAIDELGRHPRPRMELDKLTGFTFDETTIENMPPLGVPLIYSVQFGDVRVDTGFQWAGRPSGVPYNGGETFLK